jgi:hypothetical protein
MNIYILNKYAYVKKSDKKVLFYAKLMTEPAGSGSLKRIICHQIYSFD